MVKAFEFAGQMSFVSSNILLAYQEMIIIDKTIPLHTFLMVFACLVVLNWFDYFKTKLRNQKLAYWCICAPPV